MQIYHVLMEWATGIYSSIRFSAEHLTPIYARILVSLEKFASSARSAELVVVRGAILEKGRAHARIEVEAEQAPISIR